MQVGFNTALRATGGDFRQTGVSRYVNELANALVATAVPGDALVELGAGRDCALSRIAWEQTALVADVARRGRDLYHSPINTLPVAMRMPRVVTIHDLAFLHYPQHVPKLRRAWLIAALRHSARAASRVIANSQSTADDLQAWLGVDPGRLIVIPLAASSDIRRLTAAELRMFRTKNHLERPYLVAVGTLEPRKNLPVLLRSFARIRNDVPHRLLLVGPEGWLTGELHRTIEELHLGSRLVMTGFVDDATLGGWYSGADLVVLPSLYEGFGLPLLEAMKCGAPVLASDVSSPPEVGGGAARYAAPKDESAWAEAMRVLLHDAAHRQRMADAGLKRAQEFSWERTARMTWDVYREVAG